MVSFLKNNSFKSSFSSKKKLSVRFADTIQVGQAVEQKYPSACNNSCWYSQQELNQFKRQHAMVAHDVINNKPCNEIDETYHGVKTPEMVMTSMLNIQAAVQSVLAEQVVQAEFGETPKPKLIAKTYKKQTQKSLESAQQRAKSIICNVEEYLCTENNKKRKSSMKSFTKKSLFFVRRSKKIMSTTSL